VTSCPTTTARPLRRGISLWSMVPSPGSRPPQYCTSTGRAQDRAAGGSCGGLGVAGVLELRGQQPESLWAAAWSETECNLAPALHDLRARLDKHRCGGATVPDVYVLELALRYDHSPAP